MRILFALNYSESSKQIKKLYNKIHKDNLSGDVVDNKKDAFKFLKEKQYDVVVINSTLAGQVILFSELKFLYERDINQRIILLLDKNEIPELKQKLYEIGLYDALSEIDSTNQNIVNLIKVGRTKSEAGTYYNSSDDIALIESDVEELIEESELLMLLEKLNSLDISDVERFILKLEEIFSKEQLVYFFSRLDLNIRSKLINSTLYNRYAVEIEIDNVSENNDDNHQARNTEDELEVIDEKSYEDFEEPYEFIEEESLEDNPNNSESYENADVGTFIIDDDELDDFDIDEEFIYVEEEDKSVNTVDKKIEDKRPEKVDAKVVQKEDKKHVEINESKGRTEISANKSADIVDKPTSKKPKKMKVVNVPKKETEVIEKIVEVEKVVEIEKIVEKIVEVERVVERVVEVERTVNTRQIIGVMGVKSGIGVTYNTISMAKYLSQSSKVAVVEFKDDFKDIADAFDIKPSDNYFTNEGIDYYSITIEELYKTVLNREYNFIVIDFGSYNTEIMNDYYRADMKFLICGTQVWEDKYLADFLMDQQAVSGIKYLFNMSEYRNDIKENMPGLCIDFMPYFTSWESVRPIYKNIIKSINSEVEVKTKKNILSSLFNRR